MRVNLKALAVLALVAVCGLAVAAYTVPHKVHETFLAGADFSKVAPVTIGADGGLLLTSPGGIQNAQGITVADAGLFVRYGDTTIGLTGTGIADSYAASLTIDFAGVTDVCEDHAGSTVTGAAVNDVCVVGAPASGPHANSWFTCYVSAANTVKVRHCAHGASGDIASGTYTVRVFDP